jgi:hypothetical protein
MENIMVILSASVKFSLKISTSICFLLILTFCFALTVAGQPTGLPDLNPVQRGRMTTEI